MDIDRAIELLSTPKAIATKQEWETAFAMGADALKEKKARMEEKKKYDEMWDALMDEYEKFGLEDREWES
ncbi:MAG: hypothetical protein LUC95_12755 [Lachnospiraceae bacterium]|nr:hypothetical protein [Lachnospiraceae bacterium]